MVRLAESVGGGRLECACCRARHFGETDYPAIKRILEAGLDTVSLATTEPAPAPARYTFTRQVSDFVASLVGGMR